MERYKDEDMGDVTNVNWTKFKIVVPTEKDKKDLQEAFEHIHYSGIDTNYVPVNQLAHLYLEGAGYMIVVDDDLYDTLEANK
jgi:hypothetical protein